MPGELTLKYAWWNNTQICQVKKYFCKEILSALRMAYAVRWRNKFYIQWIKNKIKQKLKKTCLTLMFKEPEITKKKTVVYKCKITDFVLKEKILKVLLFTA